MHAFERSIAGEREAAVSEASSEAAAAQSATAKVGEMAGATCEGSSAGSSGLPIEQQRTIW